MTRRVPSLRFDHLERMTGRYGLYEHALLDRPRLGHGYTTDDNARALVVLARAGEYARLRPFRDFVLSARTASGWRNRMSNGGAWIESDDSDDATGRAIWGLSMLADVDTGVITTIQSALESFDSFHPRANAYALVGLSHLAIGDFAFEAADAHIERLSSRLPGPRPGRWMWPAPRLTYDNPRIPEALISAGSAMGDDWMLDAGLELLAWLIEEESGSLGFSFTPTSGRGRGGPKPAFDQQPIEAWAMADAALTASLVDSSSMWVQAVEDAGMWFLGRNDVGVALYDEETGAGHDGLHSSGINLNRGAESTLSALGALLSMREITEGSR